MNLKVTSKTPAPLLMRTVIEAEVDYDKATPSTEDVKQKIASTSSANPNLVVVKKIDNKYGIRKALVTAYIYDNAEGLKKIEPKTKEAKKPAEKKEAPAEKPAEKKEEAPKEEKPAEKKEEKPAEKSE